MERGIRQHSQTLLRDPERLPQVRHLRLHVRPKSRYLGLGSKDCNDLNLRQVWLMASF